MALVRRSTQRVSGSIWPGFVDAMTALLLVLMFVLTIFMVIQFILRETITGQEETITGQETELSSLTSEMNALARALGLEQQRAFGLEGQVAGLRSNLQERSSEIQAQAALIASLQRRSDEQSGQIASFESQVASLLAQRDTALAGVASLEGEQSVLLDEKTALELALATARSEINEQSQAARLAAARREALEALLADLQTRAEADKLSLSQALAQLDLSQQAVAAASAGLVSAETEAARIAALLAETTAAAAADAALAAEQLSEADAAALLAAELLRKADAAALLTAELLRNADAEALLAAEQLSEAEAAVALTADRLTNAEAAAALAAERLRLADAAAARAAGELTEAEKQAALIRARLAKAEQISAETVARLTALESELTGAESARLAELAAAETLRQRLGDASAALSEAEAARLVEIAAAEALREKLANSDAELSAMTLALEAERKKAEDTLTLLAAARQARTTAENESLEDLNEALKQAALLKLANETLAEQEAVSADSLRQVEALSLQVAEMRNQLGVLQNILDDSAGRDSAADVQITSLTSRLNAALAQVASEERARARLEAAERQRLEEEARRLTAEAKNLENYRSEFFGRMREILSDREGVSIVGDRFVFSSEVLFNSASADLFESGQQQITRVANMLMEVAGQIPPEIDWIIRVDGHTDSVPLAHDTIYADNWELSQARALSVVRYMIDELGFPARRLAATGFGEFQPLDTGSSAEALARNRRIELKLTER
jgi:chemotaxis protein MotB